jgi:predicted ATP-dependent endonuclease of OLD family
MRLISLSIRKLYGTLNLDLSFFDDLNLLVGINGSGKTSALSVIDWLLEPNIPKLATQDYDLFALKLEINENEYEVISERSKTGVLIKIRCANKIFDPIHIELDPDDPNYRIEEFYRRLTPEEHERETLNFLYCIFRENNHCRNRRRSLLRPPKNKSPTQNQAQGYAAGACSGHYRPAIR